MFPSPMLTPAHLEGRLPLALRLPPDDKSPPQNPQERENQTSDAPGFPRDQALLPSHGHGTRRAHQQGWGEDHKDTFRSRLMTRESLTPKPSLPPAPAQHPGEQRAARKGTRVCTDECHGTGHQAVGARGWTHGWTEEQVQPQPSGHPLGIRGVLRVRCRLVPVERGARPGQVRAALLSASCMDAATHSPIIPRGDVGGTLSILHWTGKAWLHCPAGRSPDRRAARPLAEQGREGHGDPGEERLLLAVLKAPASRSSKPRPAGTRETAAPWLLPEEEDADSDQGVSQQRADGHHVHQGFQVKEEGHHSCGHKAG